MAGGDQAPTRWPSGQTKNRPCSPRLIKIVTSGQRLGALALRPGRGEGWRERAVWKERKGKMEGGRRRTRKVGSGGRVEGGNRETTLSNYKGVRNAVGWFSFGNEQLVNERIQRKTRSSCSSGMHKLIIGWIKLLPPQRSRESSPHSHPPHTAHTVHLAWGC